VKSALSKRRDAAIAAAATLTGQRFGLLVASSLVATSAIVAGALTGAGDSGALAALLASRAPGDTPAPATSPAVTSTPSPAGGSSPAPRQAPAPQPTSSPSAPPTSSSAPSAPAAEPAPQSAPSTPKPEAGRIKHVFVVSLASPGYEAAFGATPQMPYLANTLRPQGELLSGYSLLDEAALPNGVAAISGQPPNASTRAGCPTYAEFPAGAAPGANGVVSGSGCVYPVEALTLADQLTSARFTWRAYAEDMAEEGKPANCVHSSPGEAGEAVPGGYLAAQNPFVYFHSLLDLGDCAADDVPIDGLTADLRKTEKTANYSFISPTPCDSGAVGQCPAGVAEGPAAADAFLSKWVPQILASPAYKENGLLIVTFAAANPPAAEPTSSSVDPLRVGALLLSHFVAPGSTDATPFDTYSLLRSSEDLFGLEHLGLAAPAKVKSFAPGLLGETAGD
jgi:hypothetical protein